MTIQPPDSQNGDGSLVRPSEKVFSSIQTGDVIIFEAEDFLGKCIAWITDSSVSHAAMVYDNSAASETMVEMGKGGIRSNSFVISEVSLPGYEKVHFMRYTQDLSAGRLTKVADRYREEGIQYDYPSLVLLAGLLIYRDVQTDKWDEVKVVLRLACKELDKILNRIIHHKEKINVMMCSQLVCQCYLDCGYDLDIENGLLQTSGAEAIWLADYLDDADELSESFLWEESAAAGLELTDEMVEKSAEVLYLSLLETSESLDGKPHDAMNLSGAAHYAKKFLGALQAIMDHSGNKAPLEALFVTPADLYSNAENLEEQGFAWLKRMIQTN